MRVCDLTTLYLDGAEAGVNTYLHEKARYFAGLPEVEHVLIVPGARNEQRKLFDSTLYTLKSPRLPSNPEHRVMTQFGGIQRLLREVEPTVVEVDCAYLLGRVASSALAGTGVPIVGFYHVHLPTFIARPSAARFSSALAAAAEHCAWRYVNFCYRHCERLVVSSQDMQARLAARGLSGLECVPLGVNLELFRPGGPRSPGKRPIRLLYVGRLSMEKQIEVLLEAFELLRGRGEFELQLVGDGPLRRRLERQTEGKPGISLLGSVPYGEELAQIYREADILAVPSPNDTFNLTVLEGLAAGLPVVAMNRGGPVELITPEVGALAEPGNAADMAEKLLHVASGLAQFTRCREHVTRHYSWERTFSRLLEVYDRALEGRQASSGIASA